MATIIIILSNELWKIRLHNVCCRLGKDNAAMIKISAPIKTHWAEKHDLNFEELMGTGEYKEKHRQDMIKWSEDIRQKDCGYFCQAAVEMFNGMYFYSVRLFTGEH